MNITWEEAEARMRASIENQLRRGKGHCQMHVHKLARHPWRIKERRAIEMPRECYRPAYVLAAKLCEEYGGKICMKTYTNGRNNCASRVYQF